MDSRVWCHWIALWQQWCVCRWCGCVLVCCLVCQPAPQSNWHSRTVLECWFTWLSAQGLPRSPGNLVLVASSNTYFNTNGRLSIETIHMLYWNHFPTHHFYRLCQMNSCMWILLLLHRNIIWGKNHVSRTRTVQLMKSNDSRYRLCFTQLYHVFYTPVLYI